MRTAEAQISLRIRAVLSDISFVAPTHLTELLGILKDNGRRTVEKSSLR